MNIIEMDSVCMQTVAFNKLLWAFIITLIFCLAVAFISIAKQFLHEARQTMLDIENNIKSEGSGD